MRRTRLYTLALLERMLGVEFDEATVHGFLDGELSVKDVVLRA